jgi:metal-sulfur cluster biosynthetic enzyme
MEHTAFNLEPSLEDVVEALSTVCDPELDEPITDLGFIQKVFIGKGGNVSVSFRLPTYWCSANFAYLMAVDMREAIAQLPGVGKISIELMDHFTSAEVSSGASSGKSFQESFPSEAEEDLEGIRRIFRRKSFEKRQEILLRHLLGRDAAISDLVVMSVAGLNDCCLDPEGSCLRGRYLQARALLGFDLLSSGPVFHEVEGRALDIAEFPSYLLQLRRVRLNSEFNAAICRGLLEVRFGARQEDGLVQIEGMVAGEAATVVPHVRSFVQYAR